MKVCILTGSYPAYKGHIKGIFVHALTKLLADKVNVQVVSPFYNESKKKNEVIDKIKVNRFQYFYPRKLQKLTSKGGIPANLKKSFLAKLQLLFFVSRMFSKGLKISNECDIIHAQWSLAGLVGTFIKKINRKKLIVTVRGSDVKMGGRNRIFRLILKFVFNNADNITTVSEDLRDDIIKMGVKKDKVIMIPNGVDSSLFKKRNQQEQKGKLKIGRKKGKKQILFVGHIIKEKGVGYLIEAVEKIKDENIELLLIGEGADEEEFREKTKNKKKKILFLGEKKQKQLAYYYNAADIFVLPSLSEGRPNTILEAMASEKPIIATNVGGIPELITDNKTGLLVKTKNIQDITDNITKLLDDKPLMERLASNARKFILDNKLDWQGCAENYYNLYKNTLFISNSSLLKSITYKMLKSSIADKITLLLYPFLTVPNLKKNKKKNKKQFYVVVTIDTETGFIKKNLTRQGMGTPHFQGYYSAIKVLRESASANKAKLTFLLSSYCFAAKGLEYKRIIDQLRRTYKAGHEIGIHTHPRRDQKLDYEMNEKLENEGAKSYNVEKTIKILKAQKNLVKKHVGEDIEKSVVSHRWGSWAFHTNVVKALEKSNFKIDTSAVPGLKGHLREDREYDWTGIKKHFPWFLNPANHKNTKGQNSGVLEIPIATFKLLGMRFRADPFINSALLINCFKYYHRNADRSERPFIFVINTHTNEAIYEDGKKSYVVHNLEKFFKYCSKFKDVKITTLKEAYNSYIKH